MHEVWTWLCRYRFVLMSLPGQLYVDGRQPEPKVMSRLLFLFPGCSLVFRRCFQLRAGMTIEQIDPIAAVRKQRLKKGVWKAERRRLLTLEKKVGDDWHLWLYYNIFRLFFLLGRGGGLNFLSAAWSPPRLSLVQDLQSRSSSVRL